MSDIQESAIYFTAPINGIYNINGKEIYLKQGEIYLTNPPKVEPKKHNCSDYTLPDYEITCATPKYYHNK